MPKFTFTRRRKILYGFDVILRRMSHHDCGPNVRVFWGGVLRPLACWVWVSIPLGASKFGCCECCVLHDRGLCDELITDPEDCYRVWCVVKCDLETSWMRRTWPPGGWSRRKLTRHTMRGYETVLKANTNMTAVLPNMKPCSLIQRPWCVRGGEQIIDC